MKKIINGLWKQNIRSKDEWGYFLTLSWEAKAADTDREPAAQLRATELAGYILRVPRFPFPLSG